MLWADVFPGRATSDNRGSHQGIYMAIRGTNDSPLSQARIDQIRAAEESTRMFYASNSGGAYDMRYAHILDVPLTLNPDGTRIGDWVGDAENYVRNTYGIEPEDFHLNVFDVAATTPDPGQGWAGLAWIPSNNIAVQADINSSWGQLVVDHELGHRVGAPHASALRTLNDDNYSSYVWAGFPEQYELYDEQIHGHQVTTYGVHLDEYGNPFDVMGNISRESFTVHEKLTNLDWLTDAHVPNLNTFGDLGDGIDFRLYAHDELVPIQNPQSGTYGVDETYDAGVLYGLTYTRQAERFNPIVSAFQPYQQTITLEYRSGRDGVQFHLDDAILDIDSEGGTDRNNRERELEVGQSVEDIEFGMSLYIVGDNGDDFLSHSPPPPSNPWEIASQWYEFEVLGVGSDLIGSYIDLSVATIEALPAGDFDLDGLVNSTDVDILIENWFADTSSVNYTKKHAMGDMNYDGLVNLHDAWLLRQALSGGQGQSLDALLSVPEPATASLTMTILACMAGARRNRNRSTLRRCR